MISSLKVGDLVRVRDDPSGEVGLVVKITDRVVVEVKYSSAKLFIHASDLLVISEAKDREGQK